MMEVRFMKSFEILGVETHAEPDIDSKEPLREWAIVRLLIPKDFDFEKGGAQLLKKLQDAAKLIGRGE